MMFKVQNVSVVMPAYNEELGVGETVRGFLAIPEVTEVVVADNNSTDKTAEIATNAGARVVKEKKQGYGYACMRALKEAKGDFIVLVESDNTYFPDDINILFAYIENFDIVKSSRDHNMLYGDADWHWPAIVANWAVAKYLQVLFWGPTMVEAGGTMRIIKRKALKKIYPYLYRGDGAFLPDMVTVSLRKNLKILEIPLRYKERAGVSKENAMFFQSAKLALKMMWVITHNRFKKLRRVRK